MTEDRIKIPCLDEKEIDGKNIYVYRQRLVQFKLYTKKKHYSYWTTNQRRSVTETEWNTKEEKIQQDFFGLWDSKQHIE